MSSTLMGPRIMSIAEVVVLVETTVVLGGRTSALVGKTVESVLKLVISGKLVPSAGTPLLSV